MFCDTQCGAALYTRVDRSFGNAGGCSGRVLTDYAERGPKLIPEVFFNGELSARGVVKDMSGAVIRTFDADISASWDDAGVVTPFT